MTFMTAGTKPIKGTQPRAESQFATNVRCVCRRGWVVKRRVGSRRERA